MIKINETGYIYIDNIKVSHFNGKSFDHDGNTYLYKEKPFGTKANLILEGNSIAEIKHLLLPFFRSEILEYKKDVYKLKRRFFSRKYDVINIINQNIGNIIPDGLFSGTSITTINDELPIEIQIFISINIQLTWKNEGN